MAPMSDSAGPSSFGRVGDDNTVYVVTAGEERAVGQIPDVTPEEALARELVEELQCTAEIGEHVETTVYEYEKIIVSLATYYCTLRECTPRLTEHSEIRWVPVDELLELNWAPADMPAIERVIQDLQA